MSLYVVMFISTALGMVVSMLTNFYKDLESAGVFRRKLYGSLRSTSNDLGSAIFTAFMLLVTTLLLGYYDLFYDNRYLLLIMIPVAFVSGLGFRSLLENWGRKGFVPRHIRWNIVSSGLFSVILTVFLYVFFTSKMQEVWFFDLANMKFVGFEKVPYTYLVDHNLIENSVVNNSDGRFAIEPSIDILVMLFVFITQLVIFWSTFIDFILEQIILLYHDIETDDYFVDKIKWLKSLVDK